MGASYCGPGAGITYGASETDYRSTVGRARVTVDVVGARTAIQDVTAESAKDVVPTPAAVHLIVLPAGADHVAAAQGLDLVVELGACDPLLLFSWPRCGATPLARLSLRPHLTEGHRWCPLCPHNTCSLSSLHEERG